jgi:hypothetical protein
VLTNDSKARVCRTESAVRSFLGIDTPREAKAAAKPKGVPERLASFVKTGSMPAPVLKMEASEKPEEAKEESSPAEKAHPKADAAVAKKAKPQPEIKTKAKTVTKAEAKPKAAAKPKKVTKSPAKKAQRAGA